jgi:hypothetical protein
MFMMFHNSNFGTEDHILSEVLHGFSDSSRESSYSALSRLQL